MKQFQYKNKIICKERRFNYAKEYNQKSTPDYLF